MFLKGLEGPKVCDNENSSLPQKTLRLKRFVCSPALNSVTL